jgi:hypothetical protein
MMKKAFIIGNGKSRKDYDLERLRNHGTIYGCNALYRDFEPDYLVAIDEAITKEIQESDFPQEKFILPTFEEQFEHPEFNPFTRLRSNAGMNAMIEALKHGNRELICMGFDFIIQNDLATDNVYSDTNAYGRETKTSLQDGARRALYLDWFAKMNNNASFIMLLPRIDDLRVHRFRSPNIRGMFLDELDNYLNKGV